MRWFPRTAERLVKLDKLKCKCRRIKAQTMVLEGINLGTAAIELRLAHDLIATEFNAQKYWWMKAIRPFANNA